MQESQQGQKLLSAHGTTQRAPDLTGLYRVFELDVDSVTMGTAVLEALDLFDVIPPPFEDFNFSERNKFLKKCMGARGIAEWERNQRVVDVQYEILDKKYVIRPFDNNTIYPWVGPLGMPETSIEGKADAKTIGEAVLKAFEIATYHPNNPDRRKRV